MTHRDILAVISSLESDEHVLKAAEQLASVRDAHITGLLVNWIPPLSTVVEGWIVDARWGELVEDARGLLERERQAVEKRLSSVDAHASASALLIEPGAARSLVATYSRYADITVAPRPLKAGSGGLRAPLVEAALFEAGRPVLVVPPEFDDGPIGKTVVVCWNASRESARALADAMPLLARAEKVVVATVDAKPSLDGHGDMPGVDISRHLARHDLDVEIRNVDSMGRTAAEALLETCEAVDADLIVMGGYGRSRMSEFVFGGMTRDMLSTSPIPIHMSH